MDSYSNHLKSYFVEMAELLGVWSEDCLSSQ